MVPRRAVSGARVGLATTGQFAEPLSAEQAEEVRQRTRQILLALGMLVAGTANTLTCKATLATVSLGRPFNHPFLMTGCMFCGEILCLIYYNSQQSCARGARQKPSSVPKHIFALPAACDIAGTGVMYLGLTMTAASTYQMLRGSVIIFTGALSAVYLRRRQRGYHWFAMFMVFVGLLVVGGVTTMQAAEPPAPPSSPPNGTQLLRQLPSEGEGADPSRVLLGNVLVVASQLFVAVQMVVEEKLVGGHKLPALLAVGWEGVWGMVGISAVLIALQNVARADGTPQEDSALALQQIAARPSIVLLMGANALSIAFFNFFGMTVTQTSSAAYRMILDSLRTIVVWLVDLITGGGMFHPLQLLGFALMFSGTACYNEAIRLPCCSYPSATERAEASEEQARQRARAQSLLGSNGLPSPDPSPEPPPRPDGAPRRTPLLLTKDFFTPTLSRFTMQKS